MTPAEKSGASAEFGCLAIGDMEWGIGAHCNEIAIAINRALATAREAGEAAGYLRGLEKVALYPRKWKHIENVREQIGHHVSEDTASDIAWIATVIEADIRAEIERARKDGER